MDRLGHRSVVLCGLVLVAVALACSDDAGPSADAPVAEAGASDLETEAQIPDLAPPDARPPVTCAAGSRAGKAGSTEGLLTGKGRVYNVRTPASYDPLKGHPLIMVFAAAGGTAVTMEPFTGLTAPAMQAGYVIAYVDHVTPNTGSSVDDIALVPKLVAEHWCIDTSRVYLTGHSDGGTVIYVMLARNSAPHQPAAIAPSAAGMSAQAFGQITCFDKPLPVMVLHSKNDALFPGFGADARDWWVGCNGCSAAAEAPLPDGCLSYPGCTAQVVVQYCEGSGVHGSWPPLNASMLAFFDRF